MNNIQKNTHYLKFKNTSNLNVSLLIDNTFKEFISSVKNNKNLEFLGHKEDSIYAKKRCKSYISDIELEQLKERYLLSKLYNLDYIVNSPIPYFQNFLNLLVFLNNSLYINENHFKINFTQYNYYNYKNKLDSLENEALCTNNEDLLIDVNIHKNIMEEYKNDKVSGSVLISILCNKIIFKLLKDYGTDQLTEDDLKKIKRNENFYKKFEKTNFTFKEMVDGYLQSSYYNYAIGNFEEYKSSLEQYNSYKTNKIQTLTKKQISNELIYLFEIIFKNQNFSIRETTNIPQLLKLYEDIPIYTIKDLTKLDNDFYDFIMKTILNDNQKVLDFFTKNKEQIKPLTIQLRTMFY